MIQAISFDLWNTIFTNKFYSDLRLSWLIQFLKKKQISFSENDIKNAFDLSFYLPRRNYDENEHIYTEDRISKMLKILEINLTEIDKKLVKSEFEKVILKDSPSFKKGVKETLEELFSDYKICLISNTGITPGRIINKVFQEYEIFKYFKVKLYSDEIGFYKPHPIIFKTALRELSCIPQNVIHIGDNLETDIKGAKDCNIITIWLNDSNTPKSKKILPDYEIQEIPEIIQIIKRLS